MFFFYFNIFFFVILSTTTSSIYQTTYNGQRKKITTKNSSSKCHEDNHTDRGSVGGDEENWTRTLLTPFSVFVCWYSCGSPKKLDPWRRWSRAFAGLLQLLELLLCSESIKSMTGRASVMSSSSLSSREDNTSGIRDAAKKVCLSFLCPLHTQQNLNFSLGLQAEQT